MEKAFLEFTLALNLLQKNYFMNVSITFILLVFIFENTILLFIAYFNYFIVERNVIELNFVPLNITHTE